MIAKIIEFSVRNRWLVILGWIGIAVWGLYAVIHTPVDAIPDLSENQVIVFTDWMGRSPQDIEEQITYPLSVQLQGLAGVKAVRSSSEFNFSMINIIFDDKVDFYFARTRVLERLATVTGLPDGAKPQLAPDATALGQIFWYTVEGEGKSLDELRAVQDYTVRYQLNSVKGVAEVASVGGMVREYQVDVDPGKLRVYDLPLSAVYAAIANSNMSVGGKTVVENSSEYLVRGVGWLKGIADMENVVVASRGGVPIHLKQVATVQLGPEFRRSALEKNGREAVGGVVMMRFGENPLEVTRAVKDKIRQLQSGLPQGVRVVPFYERTRLIESAIHTVTGTLTEEMIIAALAVLLILTHVRSAIVVCITLPMAVLISFLFMYYLNLPSNIMSLCGIAISIGILVDASVVMVENATHELKARFGNAPVTGDTVEVVVRACRLVGRPIFFSVLIMLISFLPVFSFGGQEGKLTHPLAFTKSFAMVGVAVLAITLVPAMIPLLIRGKIKGEEQNWIVRSFINIYKPVLSWMIDRPAVVWWILSVIMAIATAFMGFGLLSKAALALGLVALVLATRRAGWAARISAVASVLVITFFADTRLRKLGSEFMPSLNEGSIMDMPTSAPRIAMGQAIDDIMVRDRVMRTFPEVESVVGKVGRAETATDPSPLDMIETVVNLRPADWWPKRKLRYDDAMEQGRAVARAMHEKGMLAKPASAELLNNAVGVAIGQWDAEMRQQARTEQRNHESVIAADLVNTAYDRLLAHMGGLPKRAGEPALRRRPTDSERTTIIAKAKKHGEYLVESVRQEEVDALLSTLRGELIRIGVAADRDDLLLDAPKLAKDAARFIGRALGSTPADLAERLRDELEQRRDAMWREFTKKLNWALFDRGMPRFVEMAIEQLASQAKGSALAGRAPSRNEIAALRDQLAPGFSKHTFLWQKTKDDVLKEMDSELQMPGWGNAWTQPIINRVNMLATGVRTQIGVKIMGPTGKSLDESVKDMQRVSQEVAARLKGVEGAVDVVADQAVGKRYLEITINREKAARYGVNMNEISQAIETALGGGRITMTIEGRQRFPVRLRYARDSWQNIDAVKNVLVTASMTPAELLELGGSSSSEAAGFGSRGSGIGTSGMGGMSSAGKTTGGGGASMGGGMGSVSSSETRNPKPETRAPEVVQIPLSMVADIAIREGPSMIKSENGRLRSYVTLNVRDRDILSFVDEARQAIKPIEATLAGTGMGIEWSGEYEHQVRANQTLAAIFPIVIATILFLLYLTFRDWADTGLAALAVVGALCGAVMFQAAFGFNRSVIVSIGYIAAFGMGTQTAVIMLVYLREAVEKHGGLAKIDSLATLRTAVIEGAVHRLRPKLLTEGVAIVGLVPMLWATGTGAEIMRPMAAPVLGGLLISDEVVDLMIPVLFYWVRRRRWLALHAPQTAEPALSAERGEPPPLPVLATVTGTTASSHTLPSAS